MPTSPERLRAGGAVAALAVAALTAWWPASGQQRPESILPPGFGQPSPRPTTPPRATPTPRASAAPGTRVSGTPSPRASVGPSPRPTVSPRVPDTPVPTPSPSSFFVQPLPGDGAEPTPTPSATPTPDAAELARYELPPASRRSLLLVGAAGEAETGIPASAFFGTDGRFVEGLMRRLSAPLPSRWLSILLRRALVAELDTPAHVNGADFAAERAWLLLRMGEAQGARAVVEAVDNEHYTPKLYQVAMNAMLATGDPAGLCPLADAGAAATGERGWTLAQAMCAGLAGEPGKAKPLIAAVGRRHVASGIDLALARKVVGAGANGGQAVTIEWDGVDRLTTWRFGLALATGVVVPDPLLAAAGPAVAGWRATAPGIALADRLAAAELAAARGVLSGAALVDLYAAIAEQDDAPAGPDAVADDLRAAYVGGKADERAAAFASLWGKDPRVPYARLVLTAHAAARVAPASGNKDADRLVAAMLTGGLDRTAARWRPFVDVGGDAWAMLSLADPDARAPLGYRDLSGYAGSGDAALKQRLLFAGLAGLGRLSPDDIERAARALDVRIGGENAWTRALDRAAREHQAGLVVLLSAIGMQTPAWQGVPPAMLYRIVAALRAVGLGGEARMIAAEAIARA